MYELVIIIIIFNSNSKFRDAKSNIVYYYVVTKTLR